MSAINVFEAAVHSESEREREHRIASDKLAAAIYDCKERFGEFVMAAKDIGDFRDRIALCRDDMIKTVEPHLFPRTGVMRRVCKQLEREYVASKPKKKADFTETLVPEGDFKGYLDSVDDNARAKVDVNFTGPAVEHTGDPADTNFVDGKTKEAVNRFARWCKQANVRPSLDALDRFASQTPLSDDAYLRLVSAVQRSAGDLIPFPMDRRKAMDEPRKYYVGPQDSTPSGYTWLHDGGRELTDKETAQAYDRANKSLPKRDSARHTAAPDYLQKANDALTGLLNQEAEQFQEQIAPMQQALVVVQQALQEQQAANPFNVMPGGSINVMPGADAAGGGDPSMGGAPGGMPGMDPSMGGGDPSMGGGMPPMDPSMGGGMPPMDPGMGGGMPPMDPSMGAMPPQDPSQQMMARKADARQASLRFADVLRAWDEWNAKKPQKGGLPTGSEVDFDQFAQETGVGQRALQKLKKHLTGQHKQAAGWAEEYEQYHPIDMAHADAQEQAFLADPHGYAAQHLTNGGSSNHPWVRSEWVAPELNPEYTPWYLRPKGAPEPDVPQYLTEGRYEHTHNPDWRNNFAVVDQNHSHFTGPQRSYFSEGQEPKEPPAEKPAYLNKNDWRAKNRPLATDYLKGKQASRKQAWMGWGTPAQPAGRKIAGFDWDGHLEAHVASAPQKFACECGAGFQVPSGFHRCACGKQWNSYVIGTGGDRHEASAPRYLVREVPVRDGVIVASKQSAIYDVTDPGEFEEDGGEDPGTSTMKPMPSDWARRNPDGKWNKGPKKAIQ
ncbi:hypothetical protein SEA_PHRAPPUCCINO_44 [Mycobacterium phage Phrappuccino]|uniref:Uncharacterized protein n=1 Tax=Mycobacterium phage Phrappuccino TaxID=2591223 RepID=A0A514DDN5_9CAUD|nr:hypothetical protein KHQ87_gp044 [Mycobacterium phage Phrappuccino]QDH91720.1 hypothetical protein SEA_PHRAPPUCCINO_44 [Mycobacterium phage Phrappuccino]QIQ63163.1 hypothetical protein SEA_SETTECANDELA_44 [Mycobacterium phage Settecandela]